MATYRTWEELDDEAGKTRESPQDGGNACVVPAPLNCSGVVTPQAAEALGVNDELVELLRKREELERQLKGMGAGSAPTPDDERRKRCFPVKVHTKESRIEERRLRQRDELLAMQNQRRIEQARIARVQAEADRVRRQRALEAVRMDAMRAAEEAESARLALERVVLDRRRKSEDALLAEQERQAATRRLIAAVQAQERLAQRVAEEEQRTQERERLWARWEATRKAAWQRSQAFERQSQGALERNSESRRIAVARRVAEAKRSTQALRMAEQSRRDREAQMRAAQVAQQRNVTRKFEEKRDQARELGQLSVAARRNAEHAPDRKRRNP